MAQFLHAKELDGAIAEVEVNAKRELAAFGNRTVLPI